MTTPPSPLATPMPWNLVSTDYAADVVPLFEPYSAHALALTHLVEGLKVLDVAAGPGTLSILAARQGAKVTAVDFAPAMIDRLRDRASSEGLAIDARVADGQALPFADSSFDLGFSMFGLMMFADRARGLAELRRTVRDRVAIASWKPFEPTSVIALLVSAIRETLPHLPFAEGKAPLGTADEIRAEMSAAGFTAIEVHDAAHEERMASLEELWSNMQRTFPPLALLRHKLADGWPKIGAAVRERLSSTLGEGPVSIVMRANLAVARP
jgi:SAM-dependent methyltransferase